ncbi:MAG: hypothetical protein U9N30_04505 [Campylobacterota bacterium]|nr:hypothetical protein [Campylobacterota bacterium]
MNKFFLLGVTLIIVFIGFSTIDQAQPEPKNDRIYQYLKPFTPYTLEKKFGGSGFAIVSKVSGVKEKPPAMELMKRLDYLEKLWGQEFLKIEGDTLIVYDYNDKTKEVGRIKLVLEKEKQWVKTFYGI